MIPYERLGQREEAFRYIGQHLPDKPVIVETGTVREVGNWAGDGQSTLVWDHFADILDGIVYTIDIEDTGLQLVDELNLERTVAVQGDSLDMIPFINTTIDFLYLDSYDIDWNNPEPSAEHHLQELLAALPMLQDQALVAVDDNRPEAGKGFKVAEYLETLGAVEVVSGYVRVWRLTNGYR